MNKKELKQKQVDIVVKFFETYYKIDFEEEQDLFQEMQKLNEKLELLKNEEEIKK